MKKMISMLLTFAMLFSLASCGNADSVSSKEPGAKETSVNETDVKETGAKESDAKEANSENVIKIGYISNLGWATALDTLNAIELKVKMLNEAGGLNVNGTSYTVELVSYDSNNDQATMTAAANRLIYEDEVQYICTDGTLVDSIIPITEENKVLLCTSALSNEIFDTDYSYSFQTCANNSGVASTFGWMADKYPDKTSVAIAYADNEMGNMALGLFGPSIEKAGLEASFISYPDSTTDLSSLGTKIRTESPSWFLAVGGTMQPYAAVYNAGYDGQFYYTTASSTASILQELSVEQAEGLIAQADATEFEEPPTPAGVELRKAWIEEYGEWTYPSISFATSFYCILAAIEEAGTLDTTELANHLAQGFSWDAPTGYYKLVSRPDLGNDRTVDSVQTIYMKQIVKGETVLLDTITLEECEKYFMDSIGQ